MANQVTLLHIDVPMTEPFRTSSGSISSKQAVIVMIEREGIRAFGEASPMTGLFHSAITAQVTWEFLVDYAIDELIRDRRMRPQFVADQFARHASQTFGWAGIEGALWDLAVQEEDTGFLERLELEARPLETGLALGIYPSINELVRSCRHWMKSGYRRIKIKIEPGWDIEPARAMRAEFGDIPLVVDANCAYGNEHLEVFDELDKFGLVMIEQPLGVTDYPGHKKLQERIKTPICFDESATEWQRVESAIAMDACRIVNIKIQRLGGLMPARRMIERCNAQDIPTWIGTMPELGIGALHGLYLAMHPLCTMPTDIQASSRWFAEDIIDPPIEVKDGMIEIPEAHLRRPQVNLDAIDRFTKNARSFKF
ncbi:o-succinylbenzoate synthase [bacterium]|nr:o-succinylbenzoate synthase [bacterium]